MPPPLTHEEFRKRVCGVCFVNRNGDRRNINPGILKNIHNFIYPHYCVSNPAFPTVICNPCRKKLLREQKVGLCISLLLLIIITFQDPGSQHLPSDINYDILLPPAMKTRHSTEICECFLCLSGRNTLVPQQPKVTESVAKVCLECQGHLPLGSDIFVQKQKEMSM